MASSLHIIMIMRDCRNITEQSSEDRPLVTCLLNAYSAFRLQKLSGNYFLCRILWFADRLWLLINRETLHPLKRSILWLHALKRQIKGCDVSGDLAFLSWLAFHGRSANQRIRQMAGCGKWHDRGHFTVIISENAAFEWIGSFHDQSANHMMRQFAWSGISREIDKWQDGAISRHCRASRICCSVHTLLI